MAWIKERPNAYPDNFLPPHTDQFYPTKIPMYYDDQHRFNIDRALSKEDVLKEHVSYPYFDASEVTFADIPKRITEAHYDPNIDRSVLNLKNIDPQNITVDNLETIGHETIHKTLNPRHGIEAASKLLEGSIEPYDEYGISRSATGEFEGAKRANTYDDDIFKDEHLLLYAIENLDSPKSDDDSLYQDFDRYDIEFADQISPQGIGYQLPALGKYGYRQYYEPQLPGLGNAPGEVRRGILGLKDSFRHAALRYKNILENYKKRRRFGPKAQQQRPPDEGLGDAGIAEAIAAQDRAKKKAAIQEAVNIQIGTSKGDGAGDKGTHSTQGRDRGRTRGRGETEQIAGGHHFNRGGLIDIPLSGRSRDI